MRHQSMKLKWMCLLFLSLLLSPPLLWGQNHSIKGQIVDAKSNEPLIGISPLRELRMEPFPMWMVILHKRRLPMLC